MPSVAGDRRWRLAFVLLFAAQSVLKLLLAWRLPLFGDAAFYWLEGRHLAWGYSDLPGMTAWLIALGQIGGMGALALRWPFLLVGAALPWLVVALARRHFGARAGWQAGLLALGLPLAGSLGVLALPDVVLTTAILAAVLLLDRAADEGRAWQWLALGLVLAAAFASHYRAGMLLLAGLLFALATVRGRQLWCRRGWYLALALGATGALPALWYNLGHHWQGLSFQLVERNPWAFQPRGLLEPVVQVLVVTPGLYLLLLAVLVLAWRRRRQAPWDVLLAMGLAFVAGYFLLGLFADNQRFHAHWPLPGYLALLPAVPWLAGRLWRASRERALARTGLVLAWLMLALGQVAILGFLLGASLPPGNTWSLRDSEAGSVFAGWPAAGDAASQLLQRPGHDADVLVADNFRLAAELAFELQDRVPVYTLDSPLNVKHGRAAQMAEWRLDETGLFAAHAGAPVLLAVDEMALRAAQRPSWLGSLCGRFTHIVPLQRVAIGPQKRIAFYQTRLRRQPDHGPFNRDDCVIWREAYKVLQAAEPTSSR